MRKTILLAIAMYCNMAVAQMVPLMQQEMDVMKDHSNEILGRALYLADEATMQTHLMYRVKKKDEAQLARYIREREIRKACYDFVYPDSLKRRVVSKMSIDETYADSINTILLRANNKNISGENMTLAVFWSEELELDTAQQTLIMEKALDIARRLRREPRLNVWNEEMNVVKTTFTPRQTDKFFYIKHSQDIAKEINDGWKRLEEAGLTAELDSAQEVLRMRMYLTQQRKIKDIWRYYGTPQKKNLAELAKEKPQMQMMLDALDKKKKIEEEEKKNKTIGKEFVW
ncbi:MAG: hypothetical protein IKQ68_08320 [Prevotella sp.]|nr:hypothetical protein [Prevotella sp.]